MTLTDRMIDDATVDRIIALREALFSAKPYRYDLQSTYETYAEEFAYELAHDLRALRAAVRAMPEPIYVLSGPLGNDATTHCYLCDAVQRGNVDTLIHDPDCAYATARALAANCTKGGATHERRDAGTGRAWLSGEAAGRRHWTPARPRASEV